MAHRLTKEDIELAVRILGAWTGKLTWERYIAVLATELRGARYTKAGLRKQTDILSAWDAARERLGEGIEAAGAARNGDAAIFVLRETTKRLRAEIARLEQENRDLLERFAKWAHNAAVLKGMTPEQLDQAIVLRRRGSGGPRRVP